MSRHLTASIFSGLVVASIAFLGCASSSDKGLVPAEHQAAEVA